MVSGPHPPAEATSELQRMVCACARAQVLRSRSESAATFDRSAFLELMRGRAEYDLDCSGANLGTLRSVSQVSMDDDVRSAHSVVDLVPVAIHFFGWGRGWGGGMLLSTSDVESSKSPATIPSLRVSGRRNNRRR